MVINYTIGNQSIDIDVKGFEKYMWTINGAGDVVKAQLHEVFLIPNTYKVILVYVARGKTVRVTHRLDSGKILKFGLYLDISDAFSARKRNIKFSMHKRPHLEEKLKIDLTILENYMLHYCRRVL